MKKKKLKKKLEKKENEIADLRQQNSNLKQMIVEALAIAIAAIIKTLLDN